MKQQPKRKQKQKRAVLLPIALMITGSLIVGGTFLNLPHDDPAAVTPAVTRSLPADEQTPSPLSPPSPPSPPVQAPAAPPASDPLDYEDTVTVEPFEVEVEPGEEDPLRAHPQYEGRFVMPRLGINGGLQTFEPDNCSDYAVEQAELRGTTCEPNSYYPPNHTEAWIGERDDGSYGTPTDDDLSTYLFLHSAWGMDAIANPMTSIEEQKSLVEEGDIFIVDGVEYEVSETREVIKDELEKANDDDTKAAEAKGIYVREPGRLVIFTCLQNPDGSYALTNLVTIAHRTDAQG